MKYYRCVSVFLFLLASLHGVVSLSLAQDGGHKSGNYLLSIEKDVQPFVLVSQGKQLWPSDRKSERPHEQCWGVRQTWARQHEKDSVWIMACSFAGEEQALKAARTYSVSMAAVFREGGISGESFGDKCWHSANNAIVFVRGRFTFAVGVPGIKEVEKAATLALFARALDKNAKKAVESGGKPDVIPEEDVADPSTPGRVPRQLSETVAANNIEVLARYVVSAPSDESESAIAALAKSTQGREALFNILSEQRTDKLRVRLILAALGNSKAPDAIQNLRRFAESTENMKLFDEAMEAVLKSMPEHEARRFCLEGAAKRADAPDAEPDKVVFFIRGLGPEEDPPQVRVLRRILRRAKDERVRTACLRMLSKWITDACEMREDVLRILRQRLADENPAVRVAAARALGESGDVRYVRLLSTSLEDRDLRVREAAARAISTLLGWERPRGDRADAQGQWLQKFKRRLGPVLRAVDELDSAVKRTTK